MQQEERRPKEQQSAEMSGISLLPGPSSPPNPSEFGLKDARLFITIINCDLHFPFLLGQETQVIFLAFNGNHEGWKLTVIFYDDYYYYYLMKAEILTQ